MKSETMTDIELADAHRQLNARWGKIQNEIYALEFDSRAIENTLVVINAEIRARKRDGNLDFDYNTRVSIR